VSPSRDYFSNRCVIMPVLKCASINDRGRGSKPQIANQHFRTQAARWERPFAAVNDRPIFSRSSGQADQI
jgi:hypothetical protein